MLECRSVCQKEMDQCWNNLAEKIEEDVLDKYKVDDSKRVAYRGRGSLLEWRCVRKSRKYKIRKVERRLLGKDFRFVQGISLAALENKQEESTEGEEMKRQRGMNIMKDMTKKIRSQARMDAEKMV